MNIPTKNRREIAERLAIIAAGTFAQDDVKLLLIEIREFLPHNSLLKELAHFVAHSERNQGIIFKHIENLYNRAHVLLWQLGRANMERTYDPARLPSYLFEVVLWHFDTVQHDPKTRRFFKESFDFVARDDCYRINRPFTARHASCIQESVQLLDGRAPFNQEGIFTELYQFLAHSGLSSIRFSARTEREIMIAILCILHGSSFATKSGKRGEATIQEFQLNGEEPATVALYGSVLTPLSPVGFALAIITTSVTIDGSFPEAMLIRQSASESYARLNCSASSSIRSRRDNCGNLVFSQ